MNDQQLPKPQATITLTQEQFDALMLRVAKVENSVIGSPVVRPTQPKGRKVTVLLIEGQPVIGYVNRGTAAHPRYIYNGRQDPTRHNEFVQYIDVLVRNPDPKGLPMSFSLSYVEFLQESEKVECPITDIKEKEWVIDQGVTTGRTYQEGTYYMIDAGIIPLEVKGKTRFYTVTLPDKSSVTLHEQYVNITK